jgi:hypothetical protein
MLSSSEHPRLRTAILTGSPTYPVARTAAYTTLEHLFHQHWRKPRITPISAVTLLSLILRIVAFSLSKFIHDSKHKTGLLSGVVVVEVLVYLRTLMGVAGD